MKQTLKQSLFASALAAFAALAPAAEPVRLLLLTGGHPYDEAEFHDIWNTMPDVAVTHVVLQDHAEVFDNISGWSYDAVVFYNMTQLLTEERMKNLFTLTEWGVGLIPLHHGTLSWTQRPEVKQIFGVEFPSIGPPPFGFHIGQKFTYNIVDANHPITLGLSDFDVIDETYTSYYGAGIPGNRVLITTQHKPADPQLVWVRKHNNSRIANLQGGHDRFMFANPNYRELLHRSVMWTTGRLPEEVGGEALSNTTIYRSKFEIPALVGSLSGYTGEGSRAVLTAAESKLAAGAAPELVSALADVALKADASRAVRSWALLQLGTYGTANELRRIMPLLADADLAEAARVALEVSIVPESRGLLIEALASTQGETRRGVLVSLGRLRDSSAVKPLAALLANGDAADRPVVAAALGSIGGTNARKALDKAAARAKGDDQAALHEALLTWAETADGPDALKVHDTLRKRGATASVREAALRSYLLHPKTKSAEVAKAIGSSDAGVRAVAIGVIPELASDALLAPVAKAFPALTADEQVTALYALEERGGAAALAIVESAMSSSIAPVRTNAIYVAGTIGSAETVPMLVGMLATAEKSEAAAIVEAISAIPDPAADSTLLASLATTGGVARAGVITSLARRTAPDAVEPILFYTKDADDEVSTAAFAALGELGGAPLFPTLLQLFRDAESPAIQRSASRALSDLRQHLGSPDDQLDLLAAAIPDATDAAAGLLISIMASGNSGNAAEALGRMTESDREAVRLAAIRALSEWNNAAPADTLLAIAKAGAGRESALAVRGYLKVLASDPLITKDDRLARALLAESLLGNAATKRQFIALVSGTSTIAAFETILRSINDPEVQGEAVLAIVQLSAPLSLSHSAEVEKGLRQVIDAPQLTDKLRTEASEGLAFLSEYRERVIANWSYAGGAEGWEAQNQCTIEAVGGALVVTAKGDDPFVGVKTDIPGEPMVLQFRVKYTAPSVFQFFMETDKVAMGQEGSFITITPRPSTGDWMEYEERLTPIGTLKQFRFDVAVRPDVVTIDYIRLLKAPKSAQ